MDAGRPKVYALPVYESALPEHRASTDPCRSDSFDRPAIDITRYLMTCRPLLLFVN